MITQTATRSVRLGELLQDVRSGFACGDDLEQGLAHFRMNNVSTEGRLNWDKIRRVPEDSLPSAEFLLRPRDVLFNATNSPELIGKTAIFLGLEEPVTFSNHFLRLRADDRKLDSAYLTHWMHTQFEKGTFRTMCRQWVNQASVSRERLLELPVPLPPLEEQRRIAAILDKADALRQKRSAALQKLDSLPSALFRKHFHNGNPLNSNRRHALRQIADIVSGVTKGRKLPTSGVREVPYLRVANVQRGHIDLSDIKMIPATTEEIRQLHIEAGDILMTEGGDFDKLGRGAMIRTPPADCIHQNHVFRVRVDRSKLLPEFLHYYLQTAEPRAYFLACAKRTTNLASINMTQLKELPVTVPPLSEQSRFVSEAGEAELCAVTAREQLSQCESLFNSLQHLAFRGEL